LFFWCHPYSYPYSRKFVARFGIHAWNPRGAERGSLGAAGLRWARSGYR